jgi:hypothetical protein
MTMKRKSAPKRLVLATDSLRRLTAPSLRAAVGGAPMESIDASCSKSCQRC